MQLQQQLADLRAAAQDKLPPSPLPCSDRASTAHNPSVAPRALQIPASISVVLVDSAASLKLCEAAFDAVRRAKARTASPAAEGQDICQTVPAVVAIDCEWREPRPISLVQARGGNPPRAVGAPCPNCSARWVCRWRLQAAQFLCLTCSLKRRSWRT